MRKVKITSGERLPFRGFARRLVEKMRDRKPRAQHRAPRRIERDQLSRRFAAEALRDPVDELRAERRCAEQSAFDSKERQFVEGVNLTQLGVELETVENRDRLAKADMLGAQIAVAVDDMAGGDALFQ